MATIHLQYSQSVVDQHYATALAYSPVTGTLGGVVDNVLILEAEIAAGFALAPSYRFDAAALTLIWPDGLVRTYTGLVHDTPVGQQGSFTASAATFVNQAGLTVAGTGTLRYDYVSVDGQLLLTPSSKGMTLTSHKVGTQVQAGTALYDTLSGNSWIQADGAISVHDGQLSGRLSGLTVGAERYALSGMVKGDFVVSGDAAAIAAQQGYASVSGTLSSYDERYDDGSFALMENLSMAIGSGDQLDESLLSDPTRLPGNDTLTIDLPATLYRDFVVASGAGADHVSVNGGGGRLHVDAGDGNDVIALLGGGQQVDGGAGTDTVVLAAARSAYSLTREGGTLRLTDQTGAVSQLTNVERVAFADTTVSFDVTGTGGQAYRLYQAAFNRAPDEAGLGYHIRALDTLGLSLTRVAQDFINSPEFARTYGALSNHDFVVQLYANVLHRAPDAEGLKYHVNLLDTGTISRARDLVDFSESTENQAALVDIIAKGFEYTPYTG